jgi:hypothetical protein
MSNPRPSKFGMSSNEAPSAHESTEIASARKESWIVDLPGNDIEVDI